MTGMDRVLGDFIIESQENLERLDHEFVALEHDPNNEELLASIFRTIHTIKGSAGFLNLTNLEQVSHYTEDVLAKLREHSLMLSDDIVTSLLRAVDCIKAMLIFLEKSGEEGDIDVLDIIVELKKIAANDALPSTKNFLAPSESPHGPGAPMPSQETEPAISQPQKTTVPQTSTHAKDAKTSETPEFALGSVEDTHIHVDIRLLDQLMNLTGELVLSRNQVVQFSTAIEDRNFRAVTQRMNTVVSELQEIVMKTRMRPMKKVFGSFPRLVRDMSKMHGKDVHLIMEGQNTELDRTLLKGVKDPLTHLVRNALDHGIESPDIRTQLGKPATATISIKAYHEGGQVVVEVADDGSGIDVEKVKAKAIREQLISPQQAEEMSERNLLNLIFRPGFSTAEAVTSISGRGVGMDIVKKNLDKIGGIIDIHTKPHQGTVIKIRIPITLAIIPVLMISSGAHRFAIPQMNLEELLMIQADAKEQKGIEEVYGAEVYRLRGELLPLLRLNSILQLPSPKTPIENVHVVVLSAGEIRFGLIVDEVGDTEEIVVKPLSKHIKQLYCYDGATIMGDGKVALIINVNGLFHVTQLTLEDMKKVRQMGVEAQAQLAEDETRGDQRQTIVLFRAGEHEYYGVPLAFVVRLEKFSVSQIEYSGGRQVMQYRNEILPLLRLEDYLHIPHAPDPEMLSLIVFSVEKQIGLVVHDIIDTVEISTHIDTETFQQQGILGSTIVQGHSVLILDIHGLIEMAYPTWYKKFFVSQLTEEDRERVHILLVEDSPFFLNIERSYLQAAGYQVTTAENGEEALETFEHHTFDVVITDIDMPVCNGYEFTRRLKANEAWSYIPVMAVTALTGEKDRERGREAGIDEYQIKLDRDEVLRALEQLILRSRG
ncbi:chemotaxis protein CheA [candidate division KSB3 bacterium]|uniref:histidine kinase n=1 Tax=candidate division KSB3 bacterium TaxID=2044937 RepID=A0A2G6KD41_9BACT|nr:MAG: chemotaxis protein CheA [candidate division KSB3 bacterium]